MFHKDPSTDQTISRTSANILNLEHLYKVKAIIDSKYYCFPLARLLLGLYDYRLKHLVILEEINTTTAQKLHFSYNDYFNDQDDGFTNQVYQYQNQRVHAPRFVYMLQGKVTSLLAKINFNTHENFILPKCFTLVVLRYIHGENGCWYL